MSKVKRSQLLVLPKFQFSFVLTFLFIAIIFGLSILAINYYLIDDFLKSLNLSPQTFSPFLLKLSLYIVLFSVVSVLITSLTIFIYSHKIAGPIFKTKKILASLQNYTLPETTQFRSKDHFQDLSQELAGYIEKLIDHDVKIRTNYPDIADEVCYLKNQDN